MPHVWSPGVTSRGRRGQRGAAIHEDAQNLAPGATFQVGPSLQTRDSECPVPAPKDNSPYSHSTALRSVGVAPMVCIMVRMKKVGDAMDGLTRIMQGTISLLS